MDILKSCLAIRGRARDQKGRANTGQAGLINVWTSKEVLGLQKCVGHTLGDNKPVARRPVQCWQHLHKNFLSYVAENAPDPVKDIAETALKAHYREDESIKQGSKIHDFCLGIPYKVLLVVGGLLGFIITGITVSIRFGVLLGGVILAFSVTSLGAWKQGEYTLWYIQAQTIITRAIFFRFIQRNAETKICLSYRGYCCY
ncbi:hypothetical protein CY35_11G036100 [Sphagnum magellanicum]|nr:hypothetical protein CY35_11G036100 [Sphagnum magellanicum]